jgi:hypothetical protein
VFACPAVPPSPPPRIDRPRYEVNVHVDSDLKEVSGDLTVRFTPNRPTQRLVFRLWPNGPLQEREGTRLDVGDATAGGHTLHAARPDPTTLVLRVQLRAGETIAVHLPWRLRVPLDARDRVSRFGAGVRLGSFFPILAWDPRRGWVTDPPAKILGESSTTPASDFDVRVNGPSGMEALVSGTRVGTDHWHAHGVRDVAVAVGRFSVVTAIARAPRPVTVVVGIARSAQVEGPNVLRMAVRALERLSRLYGAYPWKTYTVVVPPDLRSVGIEYPTLSFIGASPILRVIVDHETAHQWFYSLVGNDQARDPWLDEALATWGQLQLGSGLPGEHRNFAELGVPARRLADVLLEHASGRLLPRGVRRRRRRAGVARAGTPRQLRAAPLRSAERLRDRAARRSAGRAQPHHSLRRAPPPPLRDPPLRRRLSTPT